MNYKQLLYEKYQSIMTPLVDGYSRYIIHCGFKFELLNLPAHGAIYRVWTVVGSEYQTVDNEIILRTMYAAKNLKGIAAEINEINNVRQLHKYRQLFTAFVLKDRG